MNIKIVGPRNDSVYSAYKRFARKGRNPKNLSNIRQTRNARKLDGRVQDGRRNDSSYAASSGLHLARELEHIYSEVMRNEYPDNNALSLFPMDRSVPPGAKNHTVKRIDIQGRPQVHRGRGGDIPTLNVSADEETFNVLYYTIGVDWDHFEELASDFANSNLLDEKLTGARDVMLEFWNEKTWYGNEELDQYGVLSYPYINKKVMSGVVFQTGGDAEAMLSALQALVDFPGILNKGKAVLRPNTMVMSVRMKHAIENTYFSGVNETVLQRLESTKGVRVVDAWEMQGTGPGGTDQVLCYKAGDKRSIANVAPMGFTQLPVQEDGFEYMIPCFMAHGGIIMRKPLMNIIGYAEYQDA